MKMPFKPNSFNLSLLASLVLSVTLTACSDDEPKTEHNYFDHTHGAEVSDLEKHKFEHKFAEQCVARETKNSVNKDIDKKRFEKPCLCIATRIMKNLTAVEAKKFLVEQKNTQSLKMSFDEAAYFCLKDKTKQKSPDLFGKK
jgi:hypothetical protein